MILSPKTVQRYRELKQQVSDCLLLMQVGAFMHVMDDDARAVAAVAGPKPVGDVAVAPVRRLARSRPAFEAEVAT